MGNCFIKRQLMIGLLISCIPSPVLAYKTDTHQSISANAVSLSSNYKKFLAEFTLERNLTDGLVMYGSIAEDDANLLLQRFRYHFYDPIKQKGLGGFAPAPVWGYSHKFPFFNEFSWVEARKALYHFLTGTTRDFREVGYMKVFRSIGQNIHLVQDMAQPSHVRGDSHASHYESIFGSLLLNPSHLEDWAQFHQGKVSEFISIATGPRPVDSFEDAFETLALFSNQNFFSDDTIFKDYALPSKEETNYTDSFIRLGILGEPAQVLAEDGHVYTVPYIIKTQGTYYGYKLAQVGYFAERLIQPDEFRQLAFLIDDEVAKENAQILIPQAVGYSAGLLDYFFRGEMDMVKDQNTSGQYRIVNKSTESMSGIFNLFYDDASDNRHLITSWSLTISPNGQSIPLTFTAPTSPQPKEKGKYILAFSGTLGSEEGAVVGSVVDVETASYVFTVQNTTEITGEPKEYSGRFNDLSHWKSRSWFDSGQKAEGVFVVYGSIKEIRLENYVDPRIILPVKPALFINGQFVLNGRWVKGDTPQPPLTWRIENLPFELPPSIIGNVALAVVMEDEKVFTQSIAQYVDHGYGLPGSATTRTPLRWSKKEWAGPGYGIYSVRYSSLGIYIPYTFDLVQLAGYSEAAQLKGRTFLIITLIPGEHQINFNTYPASLYAHNHVITYREDLYKTFGSSKVTLEEFLAFPIPEYLPLNFTAQIDKTYSQDHVINLIKAGIEPVYYSITFK